MCSTMSPMVTRSVGSPKSTSHRRNLADELDHVEGVDAQVLDDGIFGDGLRVKILVLDQHVADDVDSCHDGSFRGV